MVGGFVAADVGPVHLMDIGADAGFEPGSARRHKIEDDWNVEQLFDKPDHAIKLNLGRGIQHLVAVELLLPLCFVLGPLMAHTPVWDMNRLTGQSLKDE
ncbi:hypothetical protein [Deinococcus humi]|uniref:Uncharacterized protein n=1 Tax=Deinococcus humi TaxID=662880 RepID=A0A7W8JY32_9DEIO|nr:hypothetical protein [Deinococcus humi]MBB5365345.1 hypothetical protein [Deinococcus humi]GGO36240.1 hypothetical protein GCM10008949_39850 [Deinococcus humi]